MAVIDANAAEETSDRLSWRSAIHNEWSLLSSYECTELLSLSISNVKNIEINPGDNIHSELLSQRNN